MNSDKAREQMIQSHIKRKYCPVLEKRLILQMMLDNAVSISETGIKYIDMMTSKINYTLAMIALYTDLTVDKKNVDGKEVGANFECYDALTESGLVGVICEIIGEYEIKELSSVNAMLVSNFEKSKGSFEAYLSGIIIDIKRSLGDISDILKDPGKMNEIVSIFENLGTDLNG
jgi:hypothetical protein